MFTNISVCMFLNYLRESIDLDILGVGIAPDGWC